MNYLLDTNALFRMIVASAEESKVKKRLQGDYYISELTKIEIISVLGKYARSRNEKRRKCESYINPEMTEKCSNYCYYKEKKIWSTKIVKAWRKLIYEILEERSDVISLKVIPLHEEIISGAGELIEHALQHNFGSMDAVIAATAKFLAGESNNVVLITDDKGLIAGAKLFEPPLICQKTEEVF